MEREIKFRAWDRENKTFRYPKLFWDSVMPSNWEKYYDISQFTGLKDKNGVEIYEGDICVVPYMKVKTTIGVIECVFKSCLVFQSKADPTKQVVGWSHIWDQEWIEVIGNIYESPELLKH